MHEYPRALSSLLDELVHLVEEFNRYFLLFVVVDIEDVVLHIFGQFVFGGLCFQSNGDDSLDVIGFEDRQVDGRVTVTEHQGAQVLLFRKNDVPREVLCRLAFH